MREAARTGHPEVGEILRGYRMTVALTQEQLAERSGLSVRAISDLERGRSAPRLDSLQRLAAALDLSPEQRVALFTAPITSHRQPLRKPRTGQLLPPLYGREQAIAQLMRQLSDEGRPLLLFTGEPGIGKTRLLQEAAQQGVSAGFTVLSGGFDRHVGQEPYSALRRMLRAYIRSQPQSLLQAQLEGCAWLAFLLPELAEGPLAPLPTHAAPPDQQRDYLAAAVARFLQNAAGSAGTLLILDDLHWVDADTITLYASILRLTWDVRLRMVAAYRDSELRPGDPLDTILSELAQAGLAEQHTLEPLSDDAAKALLHVLLAGADEAVAELLERVLERAGGVPFYLVSYAQGLPTGQNEDMPWDVARSVRQRVAALATQTQEVLQAAAILNSDVRRDRLAAMIAHPEEIVDAALDEACRARLLVEEGPDRYRFAHDLIREVIEMGLGAGQRVALHRRAAQSLEQMDDETLPVEKLAYHYGQTDDAVAAHYFELSGDRAYEQGAVHSAERSYREAIDRLDRAGRELDAARVRQKLGYALRSSGRGYERALEALVRAASTYLDVRDWEQLGRTVAEIAYVHAARGTAPEGIAQLDEVHLLLQTEVALGAPGSGLGRLEAALAQLYITAGLLEEHLGALERAAGLARLVDDPAALASAELSRGVALVILGRIPEGVTALAEGGRLAEAAGNLPALVTALVTASSLLVGMLELDVALSHLQRAREVAERLGDLVQLTFIYYLQGDALRSIGRWEQARVSHERSLRLARQVDGSWVGWSPSMGLAVLALNRGEPEEARRYLAESRQRAQRSGYAYAVPWVESVFAMEALQTGRTVDANTHLGPLRDLPPFPTLTSFVLFLQAWERLQEGDLQTAAERATQARARAAAERGPAVETDALWVQAQIAIRQQHWQEARQLLDEALALARRSKNVPSELRLLEAYATLEQERGDMNAAYRWLEDLLSRFQRLGAGREVQRIARTLTAGSQNEVLPSQKSTTDGFGIGVTDAQWERIKQLLPLPVGIGRPRSDDRQILDAILYVQRSGVPWSRLPPGLGSGATANRRLDEWQRSGLWSQIETILGR